jgi:chromosome segregation ATPase
MLHSTKSLRRSPPSRIELENTLKKLTIEIGQQAAEAARIQRSIEAARRILGRDVMERRDWLEDLNNIVSRTCVDLKLYKDTKTLLSVTENRIVSGREKINELEAAYSKVSQQLRGLRLLADDVTQKMGQFGKVIPIWDK